MINVEEIASVIKVVKHVTEGAEDEHVYEDTIRMIPSPIVAQTINQRNGKC